MAGTDGSGADPAGSGSVESSDRRRPVVIGEVLFDCFPDGSTVLGGAPFNVAWHLQAFGLRPLVVTRVGDDAFGERILQTMDGWRMDTGGVELDPRAPTGRVRVSIDDDGPGFEIPEDQAFDGLETEPALRAIGGLDVGLLYHGSLIARSEASGRALRAIRDTVAAPVFIDVNLRAPWWAAESVTSLIRGAQCVKLNDDELEQLADSESPRGDGVLERVAAEFSRQHDLEQLVVTRGESGASVCADGGFIQGRPPGSVEVVDTVGAGDAFSAVWITGLLLGWDPGTTLERALDFAAAICGVRGATTDDRAIYDERLEAWSLT